MSRQLGFLRFQDLNYSRAFMDQNFPTIYLYGPSAGPNDRGTKVRIAFSREREDRVRARAEGDWTCKMVGIVSIILAEQILTEHTVFRRELLYSSEMLPLPSS